VGERFPQCKICGRIGGLHPKGRWFRKHNLSLKDRDKYRDSVCIVCWNILTRIKDPRKILKALKEINNRKVCSPYELLAKYGEKKVRSRC